MHRYILAILLAIVLVSQSVAQGLLNQQAPNFYLTCHNTCDHTLYRELEKGPVVLDFWYIGCPPCLRAIPKLLEASEKAGVQVFLVNVKDSPQAVESFLKRRNVDWPVIYDPGQKILRKYRVRKTPATFFIGINKQIRGVKIGYLDGDSFDSYLNIISKN